jgi:hypothetical protein
MERRWETGLESHTPLANMTIRMFGKRYQLQPAVDLEFHPSTIGEALQEQAGRYAFYATVHAMAQAKVTAIQEELDLRRSQLDAEYRDEGCLPGGGKITEDGLRRAIRLHADSRMLENKLHDAEYDMNCLEKIVRAFEHRRECMIALAHRTNNSTFNDRDVDVTVSAKIMNLDEVRTKGQHPSKTHKQ